MRTSIVRTMRTSIVLGLLAAPGLLSTARADHHGEHEDSSVEIGGFVGWHWFSDNNELGVRDVPRATHLDNALTFGMRLGSKIVGPLGLEGELALSPTTSADGTNEDVVALALRLSATYDILHHRDSRVRPFALLGAGFVASSSTNEVAIEDDFDLVPHVGLGVKIAADHNWGFRVDGRWLMPPSSASDSVTSDFEALVGLYKSFGAKPAAADADGDGITDDLCPTEAEDVDGFEDDNGCPDLDNDGDGVADTADQCPAEAEDADGVADEDGCPDEDQDVDGDSDGDGIVDSADKCSGEAEDKDGFQDEDGCPDADNDGDSVPDSVDKCPEPETANGYEDQDGCPDEVPEKLKKFTGVIKGIKFATGKAVIRPVSFKVLNDTVKTLQEFADVRLEVSGHTDSQGDRDANVALSQARADAVMAYLVSKGIAAERLTAVGKGPDEPIGDNAKPAGRQENRRVEFKIISAP